MIRPSAFTLLFLIALGSFARPQCAIKGEIIDRNLAAVGVLHQQRLPNLKKI